MEILIFVSICLKNKAKAGIIFNLKCTIRVKSMKVDGGGILDHQGSDPLKFRLSQWESRGAKNKQEVPEAGT